MQIRDVDVLPAGTIPLEEVSDLALARIAQGAVVLAVGDRSAAVAWARAEPGALNLNWTVEQLPAHALGAYGRQLEGAAADGLGRILLVREWPNSAVLVDAGTRSVVGAVDLALPPGVDLGDLGRSWLDPRGSHSEGALLLRGGHLVIVKEKDPAALLEFAPPGAASAGFTADRWLGPGQSWTLPAQGVLELVAAWLPDAELAGFCPDLSGVAHGTNDSLLVLSDQGQAVVQIPGLEPAPTPYAGLVSATAGWRLRGLRGKPEGIAILPDGDVLIACDRRGVKVNLFVVPAPVWDVQP